MVAAESRLEFFKLRRFPLSDDLHLLQPLASFQITVIMIIMVALSDLLCEQRLQKRLTRLRKRFIVLLVKANPECFDHAGRLAPGCFPARIPVEVANLHGLMRRAECKLAMIRCHAECRRC
jgi:hypothetical protein